MESKTYTIAKQTFHKIQAAFPSLESHLNADGQYDHSLIDLNFPKQPGLDFEVNLNLQNEDEFQISTDFFCAYYFSCLDPSTTETFMNAAIGLIAGEYRIEQTAFSNGKVALQRLQKQKDGIWETIYSHRLAPLLWLRTQKNYVQNGMSSEILK